MTPPTTPPDTAKQAPGAMVPAVSLFADGPVAGTRRSGVLNILVNRSDFLAAARARRQGCSSMMVQARQRDAGQGDAIRVGFTCSKKVGNAVARNRAKRRLREVARTLLPELGHPGWDYVLIGRRGGTADRPFEDLKADLAHCLRKIHRDGAPTQNGKG